MKFNLIKEERQITVNRRTLEITDKFVDDELNEVLYTSCYTKDGVELTPENFTPLTARDVFHAYFGGWSNRDDSIKIYFDAMGKANASLHDFITIWLDNYIRDNIGLEFCDEEPTEETNFEIIKEN